MMEVRTDMIRTATGVLACLAGHACSRCGRLGSSVQRTA
jgi:hypothetical protein